jgi:hypothetical protein
MKVSNCRSYGALVVVEGTDMSEAKRIALKLSILKILLSFKLVNFYNFKLGKMLGMIYING